MKVISFNIKHGTNIDNINTINAQINFLKKQNPDIILLQEIDVGIKRSKYINQIEYIAEKLKCNYIFQKAINFQEGDYGIGVISKIPIFQKEIIKIAENDTKEKRIIQHCCLNFKNKNINIFNTHFPLVESERIEALYKIINYIKINNLYNIIFGGDLNLGISEPKHRNYNFKKIELIPEIKILQENFNCMNFDYTTFNYKGTKHLLDTICCSSNISILAQQIYETNLSDHHILEVILGI